MSALRADVIIVGGGIMGASSAFFLRQRGVSVILLERGLIGQQASGVNFGNTRRMGRPVDELPLANRSREIWLKFKELFDGDAELLLNGHLRVGFTPAHEERMAKYAQDAKDFGLDMQMLSAKALRERFPYLGPELTAGCYAPHDGHANPRLAAPIIGRAAVREGAQVFENTEIVAVEKEGEDFRVTAADGRVFRAPVALITAGAWGNRISTSFGEPVPMIAKVPHMCVTEPVPYAIGPTTGAMADVFEQVVFFRQVARGNIVIGGGGHELADIESRRAYVNPSRTLYKLANAPRVVPAFKNLNIIRVWGGIEGYMEDGRSVMGPSARVPGLYYAFGFSGEGFQLGPGVGDVMAELIHTGRTSTPIEHYHISRFAKLAAQAA
ncbi:MAG: sarcosine oxidase subunit beta [Burkholderiales bacterium RIFCSPLOWO2_12_67_14]|nr:MAG: sarcosine oxidase subunit beta [Burkholderiales bacterium RIFCSPLOWO2_02_FULL_67_64]OGB41827.1 MAG: sarcosine oxidase subunit beta [Burkholderiales bacterium RIFCSPHIGHO2_12_FULL_67_38]OGB45696.1 MAG: sarcosine oxidase subunit beta [Burkholderiales bacterium RIFCSPLOWO2_12_67_14]OGB76772.1 MAG: sarcosine oxidase subunit beta [Burkholderiales bacterium RIFCSPLOWO2_12_FULL_67_210]